MGGSNSSPEEAEEYNGRARGQRNHRPKYTHQPAIFAKKGGANARNKKVIYQRNDSSFEEKYYPQPSAYPAAAAQPSIPVYYPKPAARKVHQPPAQAAQVYPKPAQKPKAAQSVVQASRSSPVSYSDYSANDVPVKTRREPPGTQRRRGQNNVQPARPVQAVPPVPTFSESASGTTPLLNVNVGIPNQFATRQQYSSGPRGAQLSGATFQDPGGPLTRDDFVHISPINRNIDAGNTNEVHAEASTSASQQGPRWQLNLQKKSADEKKVDNRQVKPITKDQLDVLAGKGDREILFQIQNYNSGFMNLLRETNYPDDVLVIAMDILAKVCRNDDCPHNANALLQTVLYTKLFSERLTKYLQTASCDALLLKNLLTVFTAVLREFKTEAECKVGKCLILCKHAITQQMQPSAGLADDFIRELVSLTDVQKLNKESNTAGAVVAKEYPSVCDINYDPPPDAIPQTSKDYKLRLLNSVRKTFVDTLRMDPEASKIQKVDVYDNVQVIATDFTFDEGVVHKLSFDIADQDVPWTSSTKLLEGSTVLLAPNLQEELHCAVVARRCPEELARGHVWVKLLNHKSTVLQCTGQLKMTENFTYKDDLISLMTSLSIQLEHPLPFEKHILGMKKKVTHPNYLDQKSVMQFPTLKKNSVSPEKNCKALNTGTWPPAEVFGHDEEEYSAFKHALTKALALVHCPCQADSITFGVNILRTILHNGAMWPQFKAPVLVLFNSVKALDSFLGKLFAVSPEEKVIRIGGECEDGALMNYSLHEARRILCSVDAIPSYVVQNERILMEKRKKLKADIVCKKELLEKSRVSLLKSDALRTHIAEKNWQQLTTLSAKNETDPLVKWLTEYVDLNVHGWKKNQNARKPGKETSPCKNPGVDVDGSLAQIEMARRVSSFLSPHFLDMEKNLRQKTVAQTADNLFVELQGHNSLSPDLLDFLATELEKDDIMQESEVCSLKILGVPDRWRLYRHWRSKWQTCTKDELLKLQGKYEKSCLQLQEVVGEIDVSIVQRSRVVGATTAAAAKYHRVLKMLAPRIIIVEEAGQIPENNVVAALTEHCCHLIMIGDHGQLKPRLNGFRSSDNVNPPGTISLFENLIVNGIEPARITAKHTMSSLMQIVSNSLFSDSVVSVSALKDTSSNVRGMASDIFFVNSSSAETVSRNCPDSYINEYEAKYLTLLSKYLVGRGHAQSQITILATCMGQVRLLKQLCIKSGLEQIESSSVEDFQGNSNDIILLSLVRSNDRGDIGLIANENYMSVALTRASLGLYCIGNFKMLVGSSDAWKTRITFLAVHQLYGSALTLKCNRHPAAPLRVDSCDAFQGALQGVCKQTCLAALPCGHQCLKVCHDDDHGKVRCELPCQKTVCPLGHRCLSKCYQECPPCHHSVWKEYPCGHDRLLMCSESQLKKPCDEKCAKSLTCGHPCPRLCGQKCDDSACVELIEYEAPSCKHSFSIPCNQKTSSNLDKLCPTPCTEELQCGHNCTGTCGQCKQGRIHIPCKAKCVSTLVCGHRCQELCSSNCLPCKGTCDSRCDHGKCTSLCGAPCVPCLEPCAWKCPHGTCRNLCFEPCDRMPCNLPCPRRLPCQHSCVGFCGESCPPFCRICNHSELLEGMFGSQEIATARFILLEDCGHVVEVSIMDMLMKSLGTVEVKTCPICNVPIRNCFRYGNSIKASISDVGRLVLQCQQDENTLKDLRASVQALQQAELTEAVQQLQLEIQNSMNCFEVSVLQNKYQFLNYLLKLWHDSHGIVSYPDRSDAQRVLFNLKEWHMDLNPASDQTAIDAFIRELKRAMYLVHLYHTFHRQVEPSSSQKIIYGYLRKRLSDGKAFSQEDEAAVVSNMKRLFSTWNGVFKEEDFADVRGFDVLQMIAGHWTKCANGHFCFTRQYSSGQQVHCQKCAQVAGQ